VNLNVDVKEEDQFKASNRFMALENLNESVDIDRATGLGRILCPFSMQQKQAKSLAMPVHFSTT
jgi:hypothetical protein